ncbi:hypothetical protein WMF31_01195 [Sorangium sp. So ce1036]|uniref:hypothetical protein n=1 Tax=Sorangium sp. So ce1036 TaxID=3133328 RepID=UPI003EFBDB09
MLNRWSGRSPRPDGAGAAAVPLAESLERPLAGAGFADLSVEIVQKATTSSSAREVAMGLIEGDPPAKLTWANDSASLPVIVTR